MHLSELDTDAKIYEHNGTGAEILFLSIKMKINVLALPFVRLPKIPQELPIY